MIRASGSFTAFLLLTVSAAHARVTHIEILRTEPFANGKSFDTVGAYEKVVGRFHGELDPRLPLNAPSISTRHRATRKIRSNMRRISTSCALST
jgi:hypothetical protein